MADNREEVLHICVVGFHHKKGCQLEFCYPPLDVLPEPWKHLPSLAMPDGAHNFPRDAVFFNLPGVTHPRTVFGVSCFQQIPLEKVKNRTADMTRGTVQKAVCVLATAPLYGYIQVKMELITSAFFDRGDFSDTTLLVDAFHNLKGCLPGSSHNHIHDGLSVRELVIRFRHRTLLLFKLLLLERRVVFFHSPVEPLCTSLLSLLSLHPGLVETGLYQAACSSPAVSPPTSPVKPAETWLPRHSAANSGVSISTQPDCKPLQTESNETTSSKAEQNGAQINAEDELKEDNADKEYGLDALLLQNDLTLDSSRAKPTALGCDIGILDSLNQTACGLPLALFGKGNLCFPYLSISYLDFLSSPGVRGFVVGATNVLFKQKRSLADVLVEVEGARVETTDLDLRRQLLLTTEDLRFMESVLRGALELDDPPDEAWIRAHFQLYVTTLLRTSLLPEGSRESESFNPHFMAAWKNTHNYKMWLGQDHDGIMDLDAGHPSAGALSVQDVKLRLSQAMLSSESGRKLNQAVASTGRAVGGAVTQAKGVLSGWWSSFTQEPKPIKSVDHI